MAGLEIAGLRTKEWKMASSPYRPIPEIFSDLVTQLAMLVKKEGQLARAELSEKTDHILGALVLIVGGAVLLIPALVILLQACIVGLMETGMNPALAALIVGGATLLVGAIMVLIGQRLLRPASLLPDKTIEQLNRDAAAAKRVATTTEEQAAYEMRFSKPAPGSRAANREAGNGYDPQRAA
jgi:uncharacterized membrane protein YqjE